MKRTRRAILKDGLLAVGGGLLGPGVFNAMAALPAWAAPVAAPAAPGNGNILVVVQIAGGNDGLYSVAPFTDPLYAKARPTLALGEKDVIPLTSQLGLNNQLADLKGLWDAGQMAVITNVGYPNPNLSHFQSSYIWETLDMTGAQGSSRTGWLGNYLKSAGASNTHPFTGLDDGSQLSATFMSPGLSVPTIASAKSFGLASDRAAPTATAQRTQQLLSLYQSFAQTDGAQNSHAQLLADTAQTSYTATQQFAQAAKAYQPAASAKYPQNSTLAAGLQIVATAITQGLNMRVGYVTIGGFDTHANEQRTLATLYPELAGSIAAFFRDLQAHNAASNVLVMTWSEFGRRVNENGSLGTDHGTAAPLFVFGAGVAGGVHGDPPDLAHPDANGNLVFQTDFRSVYATIIQKWLGGDAQTVLGGSFPLLDFVK